MFAAAGHCISLPLLPFDKSQVPGVRSCRGGWKWALELWLPPTPPSSALPQSAVTWRGWGTKHHRQWSKPLPLPASKLQKETRLSWLAGCSWHPRELPFLAAALHNHPYNHRTQGYSLPAHCCWQPSLKGTGAAPVLLPGDSMLEVVILNAVFASLPGGEVPVEALGVTGQLFNSALSTSSGCSWCPVLLMKVSLLAPLTLRAPLVNPVWAWEAGLVLHSGAVLLSRPKLGPLFHATVSWLLGMWVQSGNRFCFAQTSSSDLLHGCCPSFCPFTLWWRGELNHV